VTLVDALRDRLRLTSTKKGCDRGECGALHPVQKAFLRRDAFQRGPGLRPCAARTI
jgi:aerobic-type carbon monoxide dehydrogenase small subunit (CoxS/CutS family)